MNDHDKKRGKGGSSIDLAVRSRIVRWIRYEMKGRGIESVRAMTDRLRTSHTYIARMLNGEQQPGVELLLRMHKYLHMSIDRMVDEDPPGGGGTAP